MAKISKNYTNKAKQLHDWKYYKHHEKNIKNKTETILQVKGRHDPCVGIRAVPIGEAMACCVLLDHYLLNRAQCG